MRRELLSPEGLRVDGRRPGEVRRTSASLGVVAHADGSALFAAGNTRVLATVRGPCEPSRAGPAGLPDRGVLSVAVHAAASGRAGSSRPDRRLAEVGAALESVLAAAVQLALYPRAHISVALEVLEDDGGVLAACVNAACLALVSAAVPLLDYALGVSCVHVGSAILLDANRDEEGAPGVTTGTFVFFARSASSPSDASVLLAAVDAAPGALADAQRVCAMSDTCAAAVHSLFRMLDDTVVRPEVSSRVAARSVVLS